jgi:alpha-beta hydrolase superfamily lysophospholipase
LKSSTRILLAHSTGAAVAPAWEKATNSGAAALALSSLQIGVRESGTAIENAARIRTGKNLRNVLDKTLSIILYSGNNIVKLISKPDSFLAQPLSPSANDKFI